jgi:hypothetical protein
MDFKVRPNEGYPDAAATPAAPNVLLEADAIAGKDRSRDYGHPHTNHLRIARLWQAYLDNRPDAKIPITPGDVAFMMVLLKIARHQNTPKRDNLTDACGYLRCRDMIEAYEEENP